MKKHPIKVLFAMSGGIDSSTGCAMLVNAKDERGNPKYEVIGVTMKTWNYARACSTKKQIGCCNLDTINDAREVAVKLGIPYMVIDFQELFEEHVITPFVQGYMAGETPNPCILCNTGPKSDRLIAIADKLNCDYIATGHYAQVKEEKGRYVLYKSKDLKKDQTYALWGLSQKSLRRMLFPLGHLTKDEVREIAKGYGFANLVQKPESYEICFIPDNDYRGFLKRREPTLTERLKGGEFVLESGEVVGHHEGYPFYTVGQRRGLNIQMKEPVYVTSIDKENNRITVGSFDALKRDGMHVSQLNMGKIANIEGDMEVLVKIRYNDRGHPGIIRQVDKDKLEVFFGDGTHAIAPGQAAVCYTADGEVVVGGWITSSFRQQRRIREVFYEQMKPITSIDKK